MGIIKQQPKRSSAALLAKAQPAPTPPGKIRVWATATGFYGGVRIRPGQAFTIHSEAEFAPRWMSKIDPGAKGAAPVAAKPAAPNLDPLRAGEGESPLGE